MTRERDCISRQEAIDALKGMCGVISPWSDDVILISKYGAIAELNMLEEVHLLHNSYCPNCGAKMKCLRDY